MNADERRFLTAKNANHPARPSAATKEGMELTLCHASFRNRSAGSFEAPSSPPPEPSRGAMTRLTGEGKALRIRSLQAGRQAVDTCG
jgi:hypothetical protein